MSETKARRPRQAAQAQVVANQTSVAQTEETQTMSDKNSSNLDANFYSRLMDLGIEVKTGYSITETVLILGKDPNWVRKMVTGYRGKDKRVAPTLKAKKISVAGHEAHVITIASIQDYWLLQYQKMEDRKNAYEHPETILDRKSTSKRSNGIVALGKEIAATGDPELQAAYDKLTAAIKAKAAVKAAVK